MRGITFLRDLSKQTRLDRAVGWTDLGASRRYERRVEMMNVATHNEGPSLRVLDALLSRSIRSSPPTALFPERPGSYTTLPVVDVANVSAMEPAMKPIS